MIVTSVDFLRIRGLRSRNSGRLVLLGRCGWIYAASGGRTLGTGGDRGRERKVYSMVAIIMTAETTDSIAESQERGRILPATPQADRTAFAPVYEHHLEVSSWQP
jgi:hypothetical protein